MIIGHYTPPQLPPVTAIVQPIEQAPPSKSENINDIIEEAENIGGAIGDLRERKAENEKNKEAANAIKGPGYADYADKPFEQRILDDLNQNYGYRLNPNMGQNESAQSDAPKQVSSPAKEMNAPSEGKEESAKSAPDMDMDNDIYSGIQF